MDEMESLDYGDWQFLCGGRQLPSGTFQATVCYRSTHTENLRTLLFDTGGHHTARNALERAKALALEWAEERVGGRKRDS